MEPWARLLGAEGAAPTCSSRAACDGGGVAAAVIGSMLQGMAHALRITVDLPAALAGQAASALAERARLLLVIDEVREGRLTRAGAARAPGLTLDDFLVEAGRHGLYAIDYDPDDFARELDGLPVRSS